MNNAVRKNPTFQVTLNGLELSESQISELEQSLRKTTLQFLSKMDNGKELLSGAYEFKPNPEDPGGPIWGKPRPYPWPPFPGFFPIFPKGDIFRLDAGEISRLKNL